MVIDARAPLEDVRLFNPVRSLSQGRAGVTMEPLEYAAAPDSMLEAIAGVLDGTRDGSRRWPCHIRLEI